MKKGSVFSFVGAGGKTSLIFTLAKELVSIGFNSLVTTTTAIFHPKHVGLEYNEIVLGKKLCTKQLKYPKKNILVAAFKYNKKNKKLMGYSPEFIDHLCELNCFDCILVEADGSKMKPIKAPAKHEPVIPKKTDTVIGCIGLDCLGKFINRKNIHRPDILLSLFSGPNYSTLKEEHILSLITSKNGLFKKIKKNTNKILFLNKADNDFLKEKGKSIAYKIKNNCPEIAYTVVACLKDLKNPVKIIL